MNPDYYTEQERKRIERGFERTRRAWDVLDAIAAEFKSDPMSAQCFDLRLVEEAKQLVAEQRKYADWNEPLSQSPRKWR